MDNQVKEAPALPAYHTIPMAFLAAPAVEKEFDLLAFWHILSRWKWFILFVTALVTSGAVYKAKTDVPIYRAEVLVTPVTDKGGGEVVGNLSGLASMAGLNLGSGKGSGSNLAILESRAFLERFIRDEKILEIIVPKRPEQDRSGSNHDNDKNSKEMWDAVLIFDGILSVSTERKDGVISIVIEWQDRHQAALWANLLVKKLNDHLRNLAIQEAEKSIEFLNNELAKTQLTQLQQVLVNLLESQLQKIMMSKVRPDFAFNIVDPAVAPPEGVIVRPKRKQMVAIGLGAGLGLGIVLSIVFNMFLSRKK
ncbi:MAG: hypothetical protein HQL84_11740 [Magnetococcales bacterium]|nr:hypothetical protein [Magnetococcales bacterium]MBF0150707.1 hypothetical protein [Magnetococcales bacterium]